MKKILILFLLLAGVMPGFAQRSYKLGEVVVRAKRPMKEIGVTKTTFDSAMLKENIALSMADILAFNSSIFVKSYGRATAFDGGVQRHLSEPYTGDMERYAHQQSDARHDRLLDHTLLFHRPGIAAPRHIVGQRNRRRSRRCGKAGHRA